MQSHALDRSRMPQGFPCTPASHEGRTRLSPIAGRYRISLGQPGFAHMKSTWTVLVLMMVSAAASPALASGASASAAPTVSMRVTGHISVSPKGDVTGYQLDHAKRLPGAVVGLLNRTIPDWRFKPVMRDGVAVAAQTDMSLRILATPLGQHRYRLVVSGSSFGDATAPGALQEAHVRSPGYPAEEAQHGIQGTVYLVLRVGRDGHVQDAGVRQVNLRTPGDSAQMQAWRHDFASASLKAVRSWTFMVPRQGSAGR